MSLVTTASRSSPASARHSAATSAVLPEPTGPPMPIRSARGPLPAVRAGRRRGRDGCAAPRRARAWARCRGRDGGQDAKRRTSQVAWFSAPMSSSGARAAGRSSTGSSAAGAAARGRDSSRRREPGQQRAAPRTGRGRAAARRAGRAGRRARTRRPARPRAAVEPGAPARRHAERHRWCGPRTRGQPRRHAAEQMRPRRPHSGALPCAAGRRAAAPGDGRQRGVRAPASEVGERPRRRRAGGGGERGGDQTGGGAAGRAGTPPGRPGRATRPAATAASRPPECACPPAGNRPSASSRQRGDGLIRTGSSAGPWAARSTGPARPPRRRCATVNVSGSTSMRGMRVVLRQVGLAHASACRRPAPARA